MLDQTLLTTYLRTRIEQTPPVFGAILAGLVARIERGDFDTEEND